MTPTRFTTAGPAGPLACIRWTSPARRRPTALLVHGTGFCASVWDTIARDLADDFDVVAFDRRGHGSSAKPDDAYDFDDFADDVTAVVVALGLDGALGIGHSAGGTDLLLAAPRVPQAFAGLVVIEPTVMDPDDPTRDLSTAPGPTEESLARLTQRRTTFPSRRAARDRLDGRGIFARWRPELLDAYLHDALELQPDGHVTLRCTPTIEGAMLRRIADAMNGTHPPTTFRCLRDIQCPVLVVTTEQSNARYLRMADAAERLIADTTIEHLPGVGHAVPQTAPERISTLSRQFWRSTIAAPDPALTSPDRRCIDHLLAPSPSRPGEREMPRCRR
ncbi:MAG: alpha/beta hydrolase [Ilumatobacteraceae bacterium]